MPEYEDGPVQLSKGVLIGRVWRVDKKLGEGGCGAVYQVENINTKQLAALKAESNFVEGGSVLKIEVDIITRLTGKKHVTQLYASGKKPKYQYMVMSLLGESLNGLLKKCNKSVSVSSQLRIGLHVLHGLKQVHEIGFVHRDIKPANLAVGKAGATDPNIIHILDFGLSREFICKNDKGETVMQKPRKRALFRGTTRYCSMSTHEKADQSRCDDLWSLLYVMAELRGRLPWAHLKEKKELLECKKATKDTDLLSKSPPQLMDFAKHLRNLDYWTRPDYKLLYNTLMDAMHEGGYRFGDKWDWDLNQPTSIKSKMCKTVTATSCEIPLVEKSKKEVNEKTSADEDAPPFGVEDFEGNNLGF